MDAEVARQIVREHLVDGHPVEDHRIDTDHPFFASQLKIVLENSGVIDPERIAKTRTRAD